jgi:hypothetical protein
MKRTFPLLLVLLTATVALAQHQHGGHHHDSEAMDHHVDAGARLVVRDDASAHVLTVRIGPLNLPAHATHMEVAQAAPQLLTIPFDGWLTAYHPRLVDAAGHPLPSRMLHHVAFWNTRRPDFLCPNKLEHIFGAGGEMNDWPALPGFGYRVHQGDKIRVDTMFHNPTETSYPLAYLEVGIEYAGADAKLTSVYPAWFDVQECGNSGYHLAAGKSVKSGEVKLEYTGRLLGLGGHLHDYGHELTLQTSASKEPVADLPATLDDQGRILSMPVVMFTETHGYKVSKGDVFKVSARYDNPTGHALPEGAMGIVVGYFLPDSDADMTGLKK